MPYTIVVPGWIFLPIVVLGIIDLVFLIISTVILVVGIIDIESRYWTYKKCEQAVQEYEANVAWARVFG